MGIPQLSPLEYRNSHGKWTNQLGGIGRLYHFSCRFCAWKVVGMRNQLRFHRISLWLDTQVHRIGHGFYSWFGSFGNTSLQALEKPRSNREKPRKEIDLGFRGSSHAPGGCRLRSIWLGMPRIDHQNSFESIDHSGRS